MGSTRGELSWPRPYRHLAGPLLALVYVLSGKLGLMLALPPGYASAIFPPAGIAIAAALAAGRATLPWTFLGSLLLNVWVGYEVHHDVSAPGLAAALIIAAASVLQAAGGGWTLRRLLGQPAALDNAPEVRALILAAPLVCLVSATLSIGGLALIGAIPTESLAGNWAAWWIGDTIGLLVMLPLTLVAIGQPRPLWRSRLKTVALPMALAFALIVYTYTRVSHWESDDSLTEFRAYAGETVALMEKHFEMQEFLLEQTGGLMVHDARRQVGAEEFRRFAAQSLRRFSALDALEWAPRVTAPQRPAFEAEQAGREHGYEIRDQDEGGRPRRATQRPLYYPVAYVEPRSGNEAAIGFDLFASAERRQAIERALTAGRTVATAPLHLVQARGAQWGMLMVFPVRGGDDAGGVVLSVFRLGDFMTQTLADAGGRLQARLVDVVAGQPVFDNFATGEAALFSRRLAVGGRDFLLEAAPTAAYLAAHRGWQSWSVLAMGLFGTGLLGALLMLGTGQASHARRLVAERTRDLQESEERYRSVFALSKVAMLLVDPADGRIVDGNAAACRYYGYAPEQLSRMNIGDINTLDRAQLVEEIALAWRELRSHFVFRHRLASGEVRDVEVHSGPIELHGQPLLYTIVHDITDRKIAEEALARSRAVLAQAGQIAHLGAWEIDLGDGAADDGRLAWSDETFRIFGYRPGEVTPTNALFFERVHPDDRQLVKNAVADAFARQGDYEIEHRIVRPDGSERVVLEHADIAYDGQGRPLRMIGAVQDITERKRAEDEIRQGRERLALALKGSAQALWDCDIASGRVYLSEQWSVMLGGPAVDTHTTLQELFALVAPDEIELLRARLLETIKGQIADYDVEHRVRNRRGEWLWIRSRGMVTERDGDGRARRMTGTNADISEGKAVEERLRLAASVFEEAHEGIIIADAQARIVDINRAFWELTGYTKREVLGENPRLLKSGHHDADFYAAMWKSLLDHGHWEGEIWDRRKDGEMVAMQMTIGAVRGADGATSHYIALFSDITERKRQQEKIEHLAYHDALTRLPNRVLLADRMKQALARAARNKTMVAVCYLDLDEFKPVNDQYGHKAGDRMLVEIARRLEAATRGQDTVARLGGDEFVLLLSDLDSFTDSDVVLTRVLQSIAEPFPVAAGEPVFVSASIGVTLYPGDGADPDTLLRHADQAMYVAKQEGRNRVHLFDPGHDRKVSEHRRIKHQVRAALERDEFVLHWQPQIDMRRGCVVGAEALLRWPQKDGAVIMPNAFLPLLEDDDLIVRIGEWVIDRALATLAGWRQRGIDIGVSVNVAARQLRAPQFCATLEQALERYPSVPAERLEIEILETAALDDLAPVRAVIERCTAMGIGFALDDFGTGYSSMTYFRRLPTRTVKIDQSFVRDMLEEREDRAIVEGILGMTAVFGKTAVAEGVERTEQGIALLRLGCAVAQGYALGRPMAEEAFLRWLAEFKPDPSWAAMLALPWHIDDFALVTAKLELRRRLQDIAAWAAGEIPLPPTARAGHAELPDLAAWLAARRGTAGRLPAFAELERHHGEIAARLQRAVALARSGDREGADRACAEAAALGEPLDRAVVALQLELAAVPAEQAR